MRFSVKNRRFKKTITIFKVLIPLLFILICFILLIKRLEPQFWAKVESYAFFYAENAVNDAVTEILTTENIKYDDLVILKEDPDERVSALLVDSVKLNRLKSDLSKKIIKTIEDRENGYIYINFGSVLGSPILSGIGPRIGIKISPSNQTIIEFKDKLEECGINQVRHSVYLELNVNLTLATATSIKNSTFKTVIPVADTIIVGTVPRYFGSSGMSVIGDNYGENKE